VNVASLSLQDGAAWASIVGTIIAVTGGILGLLGKWKLRLPANLTSLEARTVFVISIGIVALPVIAWGPLAGLVPALLNLFFLPWMPAYMEEYWEQPRTSRGSLPLTLRQGLLFALSIGLLVMNGIALISMVPWGSVESSYGNVDIINRIRDSKDCASADKEFELALANFKRAERLHDENRMKEEREYMREAEYRMRALSCPETADLPRV
jgi:hypothetical protein